MKACKYILAGFALIVYVASHAQVITTIAGDSTAGYNTDGIPATAAELNQPIGIALDAAGNLYICDRHNMRIRKVTPAIGGTIATIAGTGVNGYSGDDSAATAAKISSPYGIAVDAHGNVYFSDDLSTNRIRKISTSGIITTFAGNGTAGFSGDGGPASAAAFNGPSGLAIDQADNIYVADYHNNRIRKIDNSGVITTIAGGGSGGTGDGGPATNAEVLSPEFVAIDISGNIYVGETGGNRVRKINASGIISTIAGNGVGGYNGDGFAATSAELNSPFGVASDRSGNVYICDAINHRVRKINTSGIITTVAGTGLSVYNGDGEPATSTNLSNPVNIVVDTSGGMYISDPGFSRIRYINSTLSVNPVSDIDPKIKIYPNPCKNYFALDVESDANEPAELTVTDVAGNKIADIVLQTNELSYVNLGVSGGMYLVKVVTTHGIYRAKVIIE